MPEIFNTFLEITILTFLVLLAHSVRYRLTPALFFVIAGLLFAAMWWSSRMILATHIYGGEHYLSASVLFPVILVMITLTYILDGPKLTRALWIAYLFASIFEPLLGYFYSEQIPVQGAFFVSRMSGGGVYSGVISTITLGVDILLASVVWEGLKKLGVKFVYIRLSLSLLVALLFDSALFAGIMSLKTGSEFNPVSISFTWRFYLTFYLSALISPYIWWQLKHRPQRDLNRPILALLKNTDDLEVELDDIRSEIARRRKVEEELSRREIFYRNIFERSPSGIMIADSDFNISSANPAAERWLKTIQNLDQAGEQNSLKLWIKQSLESGRTVSRSYFLKEKQTDEHFDLSCSPIRDGQNGDVNILCLLSNMTLQREHEEALNKKAKLQSIAELAGGIAHDFNNQLTGILAGVSFANMQLETAEYEEAMETLISVEKNTENAAKLTQQLLHFAKGGAPEKSLVDTGQLLYENIPFSLHGSQMKVNFNISSDLWNINADKGQLSQVFNNLVINAKQATGDCGELFIQAENKFLNRATLGLLPGRYVHIVVRDSGPGISEQIMEHIFDPFVSSKPKGQGLGLASCYTIIERHDGLIKANNGEKEGAVFEIYLPAVLTQNSIDEINHAQTDLDLNGKRVLLMDDDGSVRRILRAILVRLGAVVTEVVDGESALEAYYDSMQLDQKYHLVIMDLTVPGAMGGVECMQKLVELDAGAMAIVSSGYASDPVMSDPEKYCFSGVLPKPYDLNSVYDAINKVLD